MNDSAQLSAHNDETLDRPRETRVQITDPSELPFLASIAQVATLLGVSERQLYTWRGRGDGPKWIRQGDRIQYPKAGVIRYLEDIGALEPSPTRWRRAR